MKYITNLLFCIAILASSSSLAQKKINQNFNFEDGVYAKHEDFKNNKPSFKLFEILDLDYKMDSENNILFLSEKSISQLSASNIKSIDNIWGICIKGNPYMKITPTDNKNEVYFVRYYILGRMCYLYYPVFQEKTVEMFVHNPYTGKKIGSKTVTNKEKKFIKKLMHFETGELKDYNSENFIAMVQDDSNLVETLVDLSEEEMDKKLFKAIKIYNDRNPILAESKPKK